MVKKFLAKVIPGISTTLNLELDKTLESLAIVRKDLHIHNLAILDFKIHNLATMDLKIHDLAITDLKLANR